MVMALGVRKALKVKALTMAVEGHIRFGESAGHGILFLSFLSPFWVGWDYGERSFPRVMVAIGFRMCW